MGAKFGDWNRNMQKQQKKRELHLKTFWRSLKTTTGTIGAQIEQSPVISSTANIPIEATTAATTAETAAALTTTTTTTIRSNESESLLNNHFYYRNLKRNAIKTASGSNTMANVTMNDAMDDPDSGLVIAAARRNEDNCINTAMKNKSSGSLPLLQIWLNQDSPKDETKEQSFVIPILAKAGDAPGGASICSQTTCNTFTTSLSGISNCNNDSNNGNSTMDNHLSLQSLNSHNKTLYCDHLQMGGDSGIASVQVSPSPNAMPPAMPSSESYDLSHSIITCNTHEANAFINPSTPSTPTITSRPDQSPNMNGKANQKKGANTKGGVSVGNCRRKSSTLLHPDHARFVAMRMKYCQNSPEQIYIDDTNDLYSNGQAKNLRICSASSSTSSSLASVAAVSQGGHTICSQSSTDLAYQRVSDSRLQTAIDRERRRSSTLTAHCSLFDAFDLDYALLKSAAARGSVGLCSLNESMHKLTFTQSLAFPALARGLATKRRRSTTRTNTRPLNPNESGLNTCAKVATAIILVAISLMVFLIVYKFVRT